MASKRTSKDTESHLTLDKLQNFDCPFTWEMESAIENERCPLEERNDAFEMVAAWQDYFPEFPLVLHLMMAYENAISNKLENAMSFINKAEESLADIKENTMRGQYESSKTCNQDIYAEVLYKISNSMCQLRNLGLSWSLFSTFRGLLKKVETVLDRLFLATKCHVLLKLKRFVEADKLFVQIYRHGDMEMDEIGSAMLYGCKCLAWYFYEVPKVVGIESARKAIECEPTNGKWHFLLGKNLRDDRRKYKSISFPASQEEIDAFTKAVKLSKNPLFCISLAHLYRDSRETQKANDLYKDIYDLQPTNCAVRFQLALGFIRMKKCQLAKHCLDYVAGISPDSSKLAHYMGMYEEKCNNDLTTALSYYQSAVDKENYAAEDQYTRCRKQVEPDWDPLPHWLEVVEKCRTNWQSVVQGVNVHIGMYYLNEKHDLLSACDYLKKAIDIQPETKTLKCHYLLGNQNRRVNIYDVLTKEIQRALKYGTGNYDRSTTTMFEETLQLCRKYNQGPQSSSSSTTTRRF